MKLRILLLGDIVGIPGRAIFQKHIEQLKKEYAIDACIVNGENSNDNGRGITTKIVHFFKQNGVDIITTGNHVWQQKDIYEYLSNNTDVLRPANFPSECPGTGVTTFICKGQTIGVINVQGRVFMREYLACPFRTCDSALTYLKSRTNIVLVDVHAEATSEKAALAYYLDGRVSGVVGTHTHVQTTDNRLLPNGTAFISDLGMAGAVHSAIGMQKEQIIQQFITQMPVKFVVETKGPLLLSGVWIEVDATSGKATAIERIRIVDDDVHLNGITD